ncbi:TRAP transporter small permease subunit [Bradyrhizobium sp. CCGUVB1N3]|uniref:TRAP transporter small permease n=1 Tax=Bradyrhizobium sp. CCGUVB1N3 TaxID=2949629 RepID=UPI0020B27305|nr:TRAP transporter small permease [Bradyrhizobium sp. CCGUVB1N3]MCP3473332.1 TRAP transporter small permease subunit [Bradyrhizobium sp. CCGUVB1N3]
MTAELAGGGATATSPGKLLRLGNGISMLSTTIAGIAMLTIVAINGANVAGRYFFASPIPWAEESMLYLMILVVFAAVASVTWRGAHIRIELILEAMPFRFRQIAALASAILTIGICLVVALSSFDVVSQLYAFDQRSDAMEFPVWIPQSAVLIGLLLVAAMTALRLVVYGPTVSDHS